MATYHCQSYFRMHSYTGLHALFDTTDCIARLTMCGQAVQAQCYARLSHQVIWVNRPKRHTGTPKFETCLCNHLEKLSLLVNQTSHSTMIYQPCI